MFGVSIEGLVSSIWARCFFYLHISPDRARYFSLLRQRKVPKRKAIPAACPLLESTRPLRSLAHALLVKPGARATRYAQTGASFFRSLLRCSAAPDGGGNSTPTPTPKTSRPYPFALTEYRSHSGNRRAPCLRQVYLPSCARPRRGEERKGSAQPMSAPECHSLWVLSLGQARESTSPFRAK